MQNLFINLASVYVFHRNIPNIGSDGLIKTTNNIKIRQIHGMKYFLLWIDWALRSSQIQPSMNFWIYSLHIMNIWLAFIADKWQDGNQAKMSVSLLSSKLEVPMIYWGGLLLSTILMCYMFFICTLKTS